MTKEFKVSMLVLAVFGGFFLLRKAGKSKIVNKSNRQSEEQAKAITDSLEKYYANYPATYNDFAKKAKPIISKTISESNEEQTSFESAYLIYMLNSMADSAKYSTVNLPNDLANQAVSISKKLKENDSTNIVFSMEEINLIEKRKTTGNWKSGNIQDYYLKPLLEKFRKLGNAKYLIIEKGIANIKPQVLNKTTFNPGCIYKQFFIYDFNTKALIKKIHLFVKNKDEIEVQSMKGMEKYAAESKLYADLQSEYHKAYTKESNVSYIK